MGQTKRLSGLIGGVFLSAFVLCAAADVSAEESYPPDYTPSKPAEDGNTNVLARATAITEYINAKLEAAGGNDSPQCYRDCVTIPYNEILSCIDRYNTYATSGACEKSAADKIAACDPRCK